MQVNLSQDLTKELLTYGLFNMFNSNREDRVKVHYENNGKLIDGILFKYYFRKVVGVIPITESFQKVYEDRTELSVDFYINELMNAVFQFVEGKGKTGVVMNLDEHNSFIERESVKLAVQK